MDVFKRVFSESYLNSNLTGFLDNYKNHNNLRCLVFRRTLHYNIYNRCVEYAVNCIYGKLNNNIECDHKWQLFVRRCFTET